MTVIRPSSVPIDSSTPSPTDLVRPGSPPERLITPAEIHVLALENERDADDLLSNFASRAMHIAGEVLIGGIAAATASDLALDRQFVAEFVDKDVASLTITITYQATNLVDGAGLRLVDFRLMTPTAEQLAAMIRDKTVAGALLSHTSEADEARPSWRVLLKPAAIRHRKRLGLIELKLKPRKGGITARLTSLELTARQLAQLTVALTALATAIVALAKILGA